MSDTDNVTDIRRPSSSRSTGAPIRPRPAEPAADLLRLAGLDPHSMTLVSCAGTGPTRPLRRHRSRRDSPGRPLCVHPRAGRRGVMADLVEEFTAGLRRLGACPERRSGLVVYQVEPVGGRLAGEVVPTAVEDGELAGGGRSPRRTGCTCPTSSFYQHQQPIVPLPLLRHSRQIPQAGVATRTRRRAGSAHVRGILGEAQ